MITQAFSNLGLLLEYLFLPFLISDGRCRLTRIKVYANVSRTSLLSTVKMRHANLIILPWVAVSRAQILRLAYFCIKKYRRSDDELAISNLIAQY